jgi:hypothetical protein
MPGLLFVSGNVWQIKGQGAVINASRSVECATVEFRAGKSSNLAKSTCKYHHVCSCMLALR